MTQAKLTDWRSEFPANGPSADDPLDRRQRYIQLRRCEIRDLAEANTKEGMTLIARVKEIESTIAKVASGDISLVEIVLDKAKVSNAVIKMGLDGVRATTQALDVMIRGLIEEARNLGVTGKEMDGKAGLGDKVKTLKDGLRETKKVRAAGGLADDDFLAVPGAEPAGSTTGPDPDAFEGAEEAIKDAQTEERRAAGFC